MASLKKRKNECLASFFKLFDILGINEAEKLLDGDKECNWLFKKIDEFIKLLERACAKFKPSRSRGNSETHLSSPLRRLGRVCLGVRASVRLRRRLQLAPSRLLRIRRLSVTHSRRRRPRICAIDGGLASPLKKFRGQHRVLLPPRGGAMRCHSRPPRTPTAADTATATATAAAASDAVPTHRNRARCCARRLLQNPTASRKPSLLDVLPLLRESNRGGGNVAVALHQRAARGACAKSHPHQPPHALFIDPLVESDLGKPVTTAQARARARARAARRVLVTHSE